MATEAERREKLGTLSLQQLQGAVVAVDGTATRPTEKEQAKVIKRLLNAAAVSEAAGLKLDRRLGLETDAERRDKQKQEEFSLQIRVTEAAERSAAASVQASEAADRSAAASHRAAFATWIAAVAAVISVIIAVVALVSSKS